MNGSVDPDQMSHSVASDMGLHCLIKAVCLNNKDKYGKQNDKKSSQTCLNPCPAEPGYTLTLQTV